MRRLGSAQSSERRPPPTRHDASPFCRGARGSPLAKTSSGMRRANADTGVRVKALRAGVANF
eukprot:363781-Chlamydomonas_euryale.AAC.29